ncbi:MAG: hypothetical protein ACI4EK_01270 [Wujia sp.]
MKKKLVLLLGCIFMMFAFTGCGVAADMNAKINSKGAGTFKLTSAYSKDFLEAIDEANAEGGSTESVFDELKKVTIDGKTYYGQTVSIRFAKASELENLLTDYRIYNKKVKADDMTLTSNLFDQVYASGSDFVGYPSKAAFGDMSDTKKYEEQSGEEDLSSVLDTYVGFSVTFDKKIVSTNGTLSKDKKTVTWDDKTLAKGKKIYAYTSAKKVSAKTNIKNAKTYKKSVVVKLTGGKGSMYLNGVRIWSGKKITRVGNHKLVILGQDGVRRTYKFKIVK